MRQDKNEVRDQPVNGNRQPTMFSITREVLKSSIHNYIYVYIYVYQKCRRSDADTGLTLVIELFVDLEEEDVIEDHNLTHASIKLVVVE